MDNQKNEVEENHSRLPEPLWCGPPVGFETMDQRDLFAALRSAGGWTKEQIREGIDHFFNDADFMKRHEITIEDERIADPETVRKWLYGQTKPTDLYRYAFGNLLKLAGGTYGEAWLAAFSNFWMVREIEGLRNEKKKTETKHIISKLQSLICKDRRLTHLPSLFETEQPLPLASAYVDLSIVEASFVSTSSTQMQHSSSLAERIEARIDRRYAAKKTPRELFDVNRGLAALLLGDPGSGKSSLLKRVALDVASGNWDNFSIPVFVEARMFWARRQFEPDLSLLDCALQTLSNFSQISENQLNNLLFSENSDTATQGILLVDGLDEIASSPDAVSLIYNELRGLSQQVPWIATCRPTGLVASPGETTRCEIVDLDEEAIEDLIISWCHASSTNDVIIKPDSLLREIFQSSSSREMARNPFLLTALCFLKTITPDSNLPTTRIAVYFELFNRIGQHARAIHGNQEILTDDTIRELETFCCHLYEDLDAKQIFTLTDWNNFHSSDGHIPTNLSQSVIPARLLTTFSAGVSEFHFVHLSLQEFLVAKAMLERGVKFALTKRLHPAWRPVFRFYGALLYATGRRDDFKTLVASLYDNPDRSGFIKLTLAEIFSDVGVADTTEWIGEDLKEEIYNNALAGHNLAPEALIDALVVWDPYFLERKARASLEHRTKNLAKMGQNEEYPVDGKSVDSPYQLLARARTETACAEVRAVFWGESVSEAEVAAEGFALIATKRDRRAVVEKVVKDPDMSFFARYVLLADILRRSEFVDGLISVIDWCENNAANDSDEHRSACSALALIGGPKALNFLTSRLSSTMSQPNLDKAKIENDAHLVALVGGVSAGKVLLAARAFTEDKSVRRHLEISSLHADPSDAILCQQLLSDPNLHEDVISALAWAADEQYPISDEVCQVLSKHVMSFPDADAIEIACIEEARLKANQAPVFCYFLLDRARQAYNLLSKIRDSEEYDQVSSDFLCAVDALEMAKWKPLRRFLSEIVFDENAPQECLQVALRSIGTIWNEALEPSLARRVLGIWFGAPEDYGDYAALCIGRTDLSTLFRFQSAFGAEQAIELVGAEKDLLVYEDYYATRNGTKEAWIDPPVGLLFLAPLDDQGNAANLGHELSKYGFCSMLEDHPRCEATLTFPNPDDWCIEMLTAFKSSQKNQDHAEKIDKSSLSRPIISVPADLDLQDTDAIAKFAASVAELLNKELII